MAGILDKQIIIRPYQTESSLGLTDKFNQYTFVVSSKANKIQIRKAIELMFKVTVLKVNTINVKGKMRRVRGRAGKNPDIKKAIITLKKGDKIELV